MTQGKTIPPICIPSLRGREPLARRRPPNTVVVITERRAGQERTLPNMRWRRSDDFHIIRRAQMLPNQKVAGKSHTKTEGNDTRKDNSTHLQSKLEGARAVSEEDDMDLCDPLDGALDFAAATISHSNLGGQGPDFGDETLVFDNIAFHNGEIVNMVVAATSSYTPRDATKNGLAEGLGVINLAVNSPVDLLFRFVSRATGDPVVMRAFYFSLLDLDQGRAHESREKVTLSGFSSYDVSRQTSLDVEDLAEDAAIFSSSMRGGKVDNPVSALSMNKLQRERSIVATFRGVSEFSATFSEENYADATQGRNWLLAGPSQLVCEREMKCTNYECPDGYHIRTMAEFLVCAHEECTEDDRETCCYELQDADVQEGDEHSADEDKTEE